MAQGEENSGERSEEATQQRRDDFRQKGQVAQSRELGTVFMFFGAALSFWLMSRFYAIQLNQVFDLTFGTFIVEGARNGDIMRPLRFAAERAAIMILPISAVFAVLGFASYAFQIGFLSKEDALQPNFDLINPIKGFQRLFSLKSVFEAVKASLKLILIGYFAWNVIQHELARSPIFIDWSVEQIYMHLGTTTMKLFIVVGFTMAVLAGADYGYQKWDLERQMRMTKQEIKEEVKNREGDPAIKARVRRIQREIAQKRMMQEIPKADVIITNPTHIAIALKYDANLPAPQLIAKGADLIAEKIKARARELNIPVVENKPLARAIFKTMKVGQVIPRELYNAVAEVLAYVFKLKRKAYS